MNVDRKLAVAGVLVLVVAAGALGALAGLGPSSDDPGEGDAPAGSDTPTAAGTSGSGGGGSGGTPTEPPPLQMHIESIESCGQTCRDVTATLVNNQDQPATGVTVYTTIYAGDDTDGDVVWEGSQDVGDLGPGASETDTTRIELGFMEAAAVQGSGGQITILLVVETDRQTVRFVEHRDVS